MNQDLNIIWLKRDLRTQDHKSFEFCEKQNTNYIIKVDNKTSLY